MTQDFLAHLVWNINYKTIKEYWTQNNENEIRYLAEQILKYPITIWEF